MATQSEVANLAAVRIGTESRVTSLDDNTTIARTLKAVWNIERRAVLRDGSYNFSTKSLNLPALGPDADVPYPWGYAFQMPAETLRLIEVQNLASRDAYQREGSIIACNSAGPLYIRCIIDVPEVAAWDAAAVEAFALRLAWRCGRKIAGSAFDLDTCWAEYRSAIARAKTVDAIENPPIEQEEGSWIEARLTGRW